MTYANKTLSEIKLIRGNFGDFIRFQDTKKIKEKKYKEPPYKDLTMNTVDEERNLEEAKKKKKAQKCWPGYEKKGTKMMFGKRYNNCVKKEEFSDWRSEINIDERKMTEKEKRKDTRLKKKYDKSDDMKKNFIKQYGKKKGLEVYYAYIRKEAMDESITDEALLIQDWKSDDIKFTEIETVDIIKPKPIKESHSDWRNELDDDVLYRLDRFNEDWQKVNRKDKTDGMSQKAVNAYKRENPGSKLKTAVTTKPSKLKKGSKASKRRKSFCARSDGQRKMHNIDCKKTPNKRICKARRRWNC